MLLITFLTYAAYHASRKPPSIVKSTLHGDVTTLPNDAHGLLSRALLAEGEAAAWGVRPSRGDRRELEGRGGSESVTLTRGAGAVLGAAGGAWELGWEGER